MVRLQLAFSLGEANTDPRVIAALASIATADATSVWTRTAVSSSIAGRSLAFLACCGIQKGFLTTAPGGHGLTNWRSWLDRSETRCHRASCSTRLNDAKIGTQLLMMRGAWRWVAVASAQEDQFDRLLEGTKSNLVASLLADAARIAGSDGQVEDRLVAIKLAGIGGCEGGSRVCFPVYSTHASRWLFNWGSCRLSAGFSTAMSPVRSSCTGSR